MEEVWYDPAQGFHAAQRFHEKFPQFSRKEVNEFKQRTSSTRDLVSHLCFAPRPGHNFQLDIMIYDRYQMNGYRYILTCIDVHSRYAAARAMTSRTAPTIKKHLQSIFEEMGVPLNLNCDQEFSRAAVLRDWLGSLGVTIYASETDQPYKNAIIERFNGTAAEMENICHRFTTLVQGAAGDHAQLQQHDKRDTCGCV